MDTEDSEYNAYLFYQLLEEQTSNAYTLVEDVKVTPQERAHDIEHWILNIRIPIFFHENEFIGMQELKLSLIENNSYTRIFAYLILERKYV